MVNNPQELISILKMQHRGLQTDLKLVLDDLKVESALNDNTIVTKLTKFKADLSEHLRIENGEFYPDYLHKKEMKKEDTTPTKEFMKIMEDIGKVVMAFLDAYSNIEAIKRSKTVFESELHTIISTLNTRIETEEEAVYDVYLVS